MTPLAATWRLGASLPEPQPAVAGRVARWRYRAARRPVLWASLAVHALAIVALYLYTPTLPDEGLGPPSVSVTLEPGSSAPANPNPTPQAAIGTPDAETVQRAIAPEIFERVPVPRADAPMPPEAQPGGEASLVPPIAAVPDLAPVPPPSTPAPAPPSASAMLAVPMPPVPPSSVASLPEATLAIPLPPVPPSVAPPRPTAAPPVREALVQPPARPTPRPLAPARPAQPPRETSRSGFPMPMFSSLGGSLPDSGSTARAPSREMAGPAKPTHTGAYRQDLEISGDDLGSDWEQAIHGYWLQHRYYPRGAAENGEEGDVAIKVVIDRTGKVKAVSLVSRSGSVLLDAAAQATFRNGTLPMLPATWPKEEATKYINIHYFLIN